MVAKKGGKVAENGSLIIVKGNNAESNQFVLGETILDVRCHLSPQLLAGLAGSERELTLRVFANNKPVDPDPSSLRFEVSQRVTALNDFLVAGGTGSRRDTGFFTFTYSSNVPRSDIIKASGTFKGRSFSCQTDLFWIDNRRR